MNRPGAQVCPGRAREFDQPVGEDQAQAVRALDFEQELPRLLRLDHARC